MHRSPRSKRSSSTLPVVGGAVLVLAVIGLALHARNLDAPPAWKEHNQQDEPSGPGAGEHNPSPRAVRLPPARSPVPVSASELLPVNITSKPSDPFKLPYALWWFAPFYTGTGMDRCPHLQKHRCQQVPSLNQGLPNDAILRTCLLL
jgi:hypothetical protein